MGEDTGIHQHIKALVEQERALHRPGADPGRREQVAAELDQCWDLLRQREARRAAGADPDQAQVRPAAEVENYLQ